MEQQGLKQRDLVPLIGRRSKVSEVLSRIRSLSLPMLRALSSGLDIPIEILAREPEPPSPNEGNIEWGRFPVREMLELGWLNADEAEFEARADEVLREFFGPFAPAAMLDALYRIDYFWFTLMHELAHASLHASTETSVFLDDLQLAHSDDPRESDSDELAMELLIPEAFWKDVAENLEWNRTTAKLLARQLEIHPAIVTGRMRFETKNYRILSQVVGHGQVRRLFPAPLQTGVAGTMPNRGRRHTSAFIARSVRPGDRLPGMRPADTPPPHVSDDVYDLQSDELQVPTSKLRAKN